MIDILLQYLEKDLTVTWKVHAVTTHLKDFIARSGHSLGRYAEQASEAAHDKMKPVINRFNVSQMSKKYLTRTKRIAEVFSSANL